MRLTKRRRLEQADASRAAAHLGGPGWREGHRVPAISCKVRFGG